jgi:hypothetical protein
MLLIALPPGSLRPESGSLPLFDQPHLVSNV